MYRCAGLAARPGCTARSSIRMESTLGGLGSTVNDWSTLQLGGDKERQALVHVQVQHQDLGQRRGRQSNGSQRSAVNAGTVKGGTTACTGMPDGSSPVLPHGHVCRHRNVVEDAEALAPAVRTQGGSSAVWYSTKRCVDYAPLSPPLAPSPPLSMQQNTGEPWTQPTHR